ncbi:MAG: hypothetical protein HQK87_00490 [Nitrospinae bacterium]|nr:hypothetical protein [Nitrospinota bacterium]
MKLNETSSSDRKRKIIPITVALVFAVALGVVANVDNPLRAKALDWLKASGYVEYQPTEAYALAKKVCTQCHSEERIKMYCSRCGAPFVAVVPHMQSFVQNYRKTRPDLEFRGVTEAQAVVIAQVWNALVGNWESDFREEDMKKLIGDYPALFALYKTPVAERPIESVLMKMDKLKMGHMSGAEELQKQLGKSDGNTGTPSAP